MTNKKLGGFNSRADTVEENITELEGGVMETKKKKMTNICVIGTLGKEKKG